MIGPFRGGRVDAVSGVPGRPYEFYFGHVNGGVWKTINAGRTWAPVFDGQPVASIGALAVAPTNPDIVYVGSGESTLRDSNGYGNGVYKSTDAGKTWTHLGLDLTHHIGRVAIDPKKRRRRLRRRHRRSLRRDADRGSTRRRRRQDVDEVALQGQQHRRRRRRDRSVELAQSSTRACGRRVARRGTPTRRRTAPAAASTNQPTPAPTWTQLTNGLPSEGWPQRPGDRAEQSAPRLRRDRCERRRPVSIGRCRRDVG
jgi:hypothetical protein